MTTTVKITNANADDEQKKAVCVKVVVKHGPVQSKVLLAGEDAEFHVYDGQGIVVEEVSTEEDAEGTVLSDEVAVEDSAA